MVGIELTVIFDESWQHLLVVSYILLLFFPHLCRSLKFTKDGTNVKKKCKKNRCNVVFIKFIH